MYGNNELQKFFSETLYGYHLVNEEPLKEHKWEEVNRSVFMEGGMDQITNSARGKHTVALDFMMEDFLISNKTGKIKNGKLHISSYRLSAHCGMGKKNLIDEVVKVIKTKDKNINHYSILARYNEGNHLRYIWYFIPSDCDIFSPDKPWREIIGKRKNNQGKLCGWASEFMDIRFSMSSQLWFTIPIEKIKKYKVAEVNVVEERKMTYAELYRQFQKK